MQFLELAISQYLLSGNCYIYAVQVASHNGTIIKELQLLRPDRVEVILLQNGTRFYRYTIDETVQDIFPDENGISNILHIKTFHPLNNLYGLPMLSSAKQSLEYQNECIKWGRTLLRNGGRPSGAIIVNQEGNLGGSLTDEQFEQLKTQVKQNNSTEIEDAFKTWVLENGMKWQQVGVSPKDVDVADARDISARYIAGTLGYHHKCLAYQETTLIAICLKQDLAYGKTQ